jgi:hypothetical protein
MSLRVALILASASFGFAAQNYASVANVVKLVRDGVAHHDSDATIAKLLHKQKLLDRLEYRVLDGLESEGAGPKTMAELDRFYQTSRDLPAPAVEPSFPEEPIPSIADQRRIVHDTQQTALNYAHSLPDYFCNESIRRFADTRGIEELVDVLEVKLTYFDGQENYRVMTVNGRPTTRALEEVGGSVSKGEFGSMLNSVFAGESKTVLQWDHWTTVRSRSAHVYKFRIEAKNSAYRLQFRSSNRFMPQSTMVGQHGYVYIDRETNQVLRIVAEADTIPRDFPVRQSSTVLDYDFTDVGGRRFLLPLRADVRMATDSIHTRNLVDFHSYRKFTGESTITFQ